MIHYTCDVCGAPLPGSYRRGNKLLQLAQLCGITDVCPACQEVGPRIDISSLLLNAWRSKAEIADISVLAEQDLLREHNGPPASPKFSGRAGEEKKKILERLTVYRAANGLGCLDTVAKLAGPAVSDCLLRDMLIGAASPPIEDWRRIGKALDKLEGRNE